MSRTNQTDAKPGADPVGSERNSLLTFAAELRQAAFTLEMIKGVTAWDLAIIHSAADQFGRLFNRAGRQDTAAGPNTNLGQISKSLVDGTAAGERDADAESLWSRLEGLARDAMCRDDRREFLDLAARLRSVAPAGRDDYAESMNCGCVLTIIEVENRCGKNHDWFGEFRSVAPAAEQSLEQRGPGPQEMLEYERDQAAQPVAVAPASEREWLARTIYGEVSDEIWNNPNETDASECYKIADLILARYERAAAPPASERTEWIEKAYAIQDDNVFDPRTLMERVYDELVAAPVAVAEPAERREEIAMLLWDWAGVKDDYSEALKFADAVLAALAAPAPAQPAPSLVDCAECNGTGLVPDAYYPSQRRQCMACDGGGLVEAQPAPEDAP